MPLFIHSNALLKGIRDQAFRRDRLLRPPHPAVDDRRRDKGRHEGLTVLQALIITSNTLFYFPGRHAGDFFARQP